MPHAFRSKSLAIVPLLFVITNGVTQAQAVNVIPETLLAPSDLEVTLDPAQMKERKVTAAPIERSINPADLAWIDPRKTVENSSRPKILIGNGGAGLITTPDPVVERTVSPPAQEVPVWRANTSGN